MIRRAAERLVRESLADTPVVLIHGPRQAGKSTLAKAVATSLGVHQLTLDDPIPLELATRDPSAFLAAYPAPLLIDEIQRAPGLFLPLKAAVDRDRKSGSYLLTGSANVLALPKIADSLAGRMSVVDLMPFSQSEIDGVESMFLDNLFDPAWSPAAAPEERELVDRVVRGGFPEPWSRPSAGRREAWFADYMRTILERDVRDLANIEGLTQMPRLLRLLAARSGEPLNVVGLVRETGIPNTSLHRYLDLLRSVFLIFTVPAWSQNPDLRLTRTAKAFLVDSGLLAYLNNLTPKSLAADEAKMGQALEALVATEFRKLSPVSETRPDLYHLRTVRHLQLAFVLEARGGDVVGVDISPKPTVQPSDADGLRFLRDLAGPQFKRGIVLYTGAEVQVLDQNIQALPIACLWQ